MAIAPALLFGLSMAQAIPVIQHGRAHGKNTSAVRRDAAESVRYALSIALMVKPTSYHQFKGLAYWALGRGSPGEDPPKELDELLEEETRFATLRIFATSGFLALLVVPFQVRIPPGISSLLDPLGKLCLAGLLLGVPGGLGYLLASNVSPNIRAHNRVCIYIAYFSVLGAALVFDQLRRSFVVPVVGSRWTSRSRRSWLSVSSTSCPGSNRLRWSSPAMKGREADRWHARLWALPPRRVVEKWKPPASAELASIETVTTTIAVELVTELCWILGSDPLENPDHRFAFLALSPANPPAKVVGAR